MFAVDDDGRCTRAAGADVDYENQSEFTLSFLESVAIGQGKNPSLLEWALSRPCRTYNELKARNGRGSNVLPRRANAEGSYLGQERDLQWGLLAKQEVRGA